ncbi:unnamed protein product [Ascophyllum nodosum]
MLAHGFILHEAQGDSADDEPTLSLLFYYCKSALAMIAVIITMLLWWRSTEATRVRKIVRRDGSQILPTPVPVLPRWLGFFGGHTVLINPPKLTTQVENWAEELGGDYELNIFGWSVVVLTSVADIRRVLTLRPSKFKRGLESRWLAKQAGVMPSMFFNEGKEWGRSRRLISPNLVGHNVTAMIPYISKVGDRLCTRLGDDAESCNVVDAKQYFARFTHDIIALAAFGIDVNSTGATGDSPCPSYEAIESTLTIVSLMLETIRKLQWKYLSTLVPWVRRVKESSHKMNAIVQRAIDAARSDNVREVSSTDGDEVFAGTLLRKIVGGPDSGAASDRMKFSDSEILHEVKSLFVAGTDTTSLALSWAMYYLVKNPAAFSRCRTEGLKVAPMSAGMVSTSEQLSQLVFCAAVFREVVRLRTAGPLLIHTCLEDHLTKSGFKIEKGRQVIVLNRFASTSEDNFTRGAEFVPERWIESERAEALLGKGVGDGEGRDIRHVDEAFLGFGSGPRVCPGQDLAKAEAITIIAAICSRFDVALAPGQPDPPEEITHFTLSPKAINLMFKRKEGANTEIDSSK